MRVPVNAYITTILSNKGAMFYFPHDQFPDKLHPTMVVGITDTNELMLVAGTSNIEGRIAAITREGLPQHTIVCCYNQDCEKLDKEKETAFDCNQIFPCHYDVFKQKIEKNEIGSIGTLSDEKVLKIYKGIIDSPKVEKYYKKLVDEYFSGMF
jgi:hypothetical protein